LFNISIAFLKALLEPTGISDSEKEAMIAAAVKVLASYTRIISLLPPGIAKEHMVLKIRGKEWELELLSNSGAARNPVVALDWQFQLRILELQFEKMEGVEKALLLKYPQLVKKPSVINVK